ncbi:MAG: LysM peptidoglycan-binding domain-containing protein [Limnochordales bacterium]
MSEYGIWLSFNNQQEGFQIPVMPEQIELGEAGQGQTYNVVGLGQINVIKSPKLTEVGWSSEFPAQRYPWVTSDVLLPPGTYVDYLRRWMATKRPIRFVFAGPSFDINMPVTIESFQYREVSGQEGDIQYTIKLKKYVFYAAQKVQVVQPSGASAPVIQTQPQPRPDDRQVPATYTLAPGDTLWAVAQRFLGDGSRWREIQQLNGISDAELKRLPVGLVLRLPER